MYEFGCVMYQCKFPKWENITAQINPNDLYYDKSEGINGLETEPHITVIYGLHSNIDHKKLIKHLRGLPPINVKMVAVDSFFSDEYDVLKIKLDCDELFNIRKTLINNYKNTQTFKDFNPHITIAYLKKGTSKKYHNNNVDLDFTCDEIKYTSPIGHKININL